MTKAVLICTLIFLLPLSACFFTDSEIYEIIPVADDPALLTVVSNLDTLFHPLVGDSLEVFYSASIVNGELYFMEALFSEEIFFASDSLEGSFWIYASQSTGLDSLVLDFYHSSNTNTLADLTGYEAGITSQSYAIDFGGEEPK